MEYVTVMNGLYALTDHNWEKFLTMVGKGAVAGQVAMELGKYLGHCRSVTDWTPEDAKAEEACLPKKRLPLHTRRRLWHRPI